MSITFKILWQCIFDIVYFPIWWYSVGAKKFLFACLDIIADGNSNFAPGLWLKNIFVPMFGQTDWQGRIMSFFMRLANVIGRGIALVFWICIVFCIFLLYLVVPAFVVFEWLTALFY